jgi:hypothetical protein
VVYDKYKTARVSDRSHRITWVDFLRPESLIRVTGSHELIFKAGDNQLVRSGDSDQTLLRFSYFNTLLAVSTNIETEQITNGNLKLKGSRRHYQKSNMMHWWHCMGLNELKHLVVGNSKCINKDDKISLLTSWLLFTLTNASASCWRNAHLITLTRWNKHIHYTCQLVKSFLLWLSHFWQINSSVF